MSKERSPTVSQGGARTAQTSRRDIDKVLKTLGTMPRILCWKCRKLTPFELERCQHCGSPFAGSTGGAYGSGRATMTRSTFVPEEAHVSRRRSIAEIFQDLQRVHDASDSPRETSSEDEDSRHLYQCPTCGRFVSEQAADCVCGARFVPSSFESFVCPECASRVPYEDDACPVCGVEFEGPLPPDGYAFACQRCGAHVASDAVRCSCGAWFED